MPAFLLSPIARWLIGAAVIVLGMFLFVAHERSVGAAKELAKEQAATAKEAARRKQIEAYMQQWATGSIAHVDALNNKIAALQAKAARLSAAHDKEPCWLPDATARLREMGQ